VSAQRQAYAPYAIQPAQSGRRAHVEPDDPLRNPFDLDRHRVIECTAFRRLGGKTQVFAPVYHDHFRTRLKHSIEAADIARCLAVALQANEQLAEVVTLAHDLGHPPFGHAGEAALNEALAEHGGFNHNAHSLRVVEYLEHPFPAFRGLNLTDATRAGLLTHATRYDVPGSRECPSPRAAGFSPRGIINVDIACRTNDDPSGHHDGPSVEAQVASIADRIAYNHHDLEDAIGAGFIGLDDLKVIALWREAMNAIRGGAGEDHIHRIRRVVLDAMRDAVLTDVVTTSRPRLAGLSSPEEVRRRGESLVGPSDAMEQRLSELETFLLDRVYRQPEIASMDAHGRSMVLDLFAAYRKNPAALPPRFVSRIDEQGVDRVIADYIAGMTDRFCGTEHARLA